MKLSLKNLLITMTGKFTERKVSWEQAALSSRSLADNISK